MPRCARHDNPNPVWAECRVVRGGDNPPSNEPKHMFTRSLFIAVLIFVGATPGGFAQQAPPKEIQLPTTKSLELPLIGEPQRTNSLPTAVALSPDGKFLAILNNGYGTADSDYHQSIAVLDLATNQLRDFPDARLPLKAAQTYFLGLAWGSDGQELYASMASLTDPEGKKPSDTGNGIAVYRFADGALTPDRFLRLPIVPLHHGARYTYEAKWVEKGYAVPYPAGLAVVKRDGGDALLVAENLADDAVLLDTKDGKILQRFALGHGKWVPSEFPDGAMATRDGNRGWISLWNGSTAAELDLQRGKVIRTIKLRTPEKKTDASSHPTAMLLSPDEKHLYVTLTNRDEVAVVAAKSGAVERYLDTRLPGQTYGGSFPDALAQSADGNTLYVANASSDAVAVFDLRAAQPSAGYFLPTEWYPTALAIHGDELLIASGKGQGTTANGNWVPSRFNSAKQEHPYIPTLVHGSIARVNLPDAEKQKQKLTAEVVRTNKMEGRIGDIEFQHGSNPIKHVIYIIKENRTYDQLFGDIKEANGDASLVMYGEDITPNQHALARQFGILDNFYDSGEVSGDGHQWSTAAITTDYNEKTWQVGYRGRERSYDYEGFVGDQDPLGQGISDVDEPETGYLWGNLARHGLTYRHYGEFVATWWCVDMAQPYTPASTGEQGAKHPNCPVPEVKPGENLPAALGGGKSPYQFAIPMMAYDIATKPELRGHFDPHFADFKVEYPDQFRADEFLREFSGFVEARKTGKGKPLPAFIVLRFPNDHTAGTKAGSPMPKASVADNDLAVGRLVEAVSNSPYWDDTAIFVLEDDAQNGADHVDAHRSIALVISKYSPGSLQQPFIESHFYTTVNVIHTMEALVGLPPMNNNDAHAALMVPLFTGSGQQAPYRADYRNRDGGLIYRANTKDTPGADDSAKLDFSHADAADTDKLNAILWRDAKGDAPMPEPQHTVFPSAGEK